MTGLLIGISGLTFVGLFVLIRLVLDDVATVAIALGRRWQRRSAWLTRRERAAAVSETSRWATGVKAVWGTPLGFGAVGGLAVGSVWLANPVLTAWFVVFGAGIGWLVTLSRPAVREDLKAVELFVGTLRSVFSAGQSVFAALAAVAEYLDPGPLRTAVEATTRQYRADFDGRAALAYMTALRWPHLTQLVLILEQVNQADEQTVRDALSDLEARLRTAGRVRDRANTVLVLSRLTLRVLQAANLAALALATFLPTWRAFYLDNPLTLMGVTALGVLSSAYFAGELNRLATEI